MIGLALLALMAGLGFGLGFSAPTSLLAGTEAAKPQLEVGVKLAQEVYAQALAAFYLGEYDQAEAFFLSLESRVSPFLAEGLIFWKAECAFRQGQVEVARTVFEESLRRAPQGRRAQMARQRLELLASLGR